MRKGFTLIEVLVVAVIVAILAAVAIPAYNGYIQSSKEKVARNTAGTVAAALAAYYSEWQNAKATLDALGAAPGGTITYNTVSCKMPADFGCSIASGIVTVYSIDNTASDSVPWY